MPIEIRFEIMTPYLPKIFIESQNNRLSPLHELWTQACIVYVDLIPSQGYGHLYDIFPYLSFRLMLKIFLMEENSEGFAFDRTFDSIFCCVSSI